MPDLEFEPSPDSVVFNRPAVNDLVPPHAFVPSEFAPESGCCDRCGGGPGAQIHKAPVDHMARIADALERIADSMERTEDEAPAMSYGEVQALLKATHSKADGE